LDTRAILECIRRLKANNEWQKIYDFLPPERLQSDPQLWNTPAIVSEIAYCCSKLSEVSARDLQKLPPEKRREFLTEKSKRRAEAQGLFERCCELQPQRPGYWSDLAYLHYRCAQELTQPGGRRDASPITAVELAKKPLDQALGLDSTRVQDHYRRGYLLTRILPNQILFGGKNKRGDGKFKEAFDARTQGIGSLKAAVGAWEFLQSGDSRKERYRKEYLRAQYALGNAYYDLIINDWDVQAFLGISPPDQVFDDLNNAAESWKWFKRCWCEDVPNAAAGYSLIDLPTDGVECGEDKAYSLGKTLAASAWIQSESGSSWDDEAMDCRQWSEYFLRRSLDFPYPPEKSSQRKDHVRERLARLYLMAGDFKLADEVLATLRQNKRVDPYIVHTWAVALIKLGRTDEGRRRLVEALQDRGNVDKATTQALLDYVDSLAC
jgi:hypothetical protein